MENRRLVVLGLVAAVLGLAACGLIATRVQLVPAAVSVEAPGGVRVVYEKTHRDIMHFRIYNRSGEMLMVERDMIKLYTPRGEQTRVAGRGATAYQIFPGGFHDVDLRFDFSQVRPGEEIRVDFRDAVLLNGQPVHIEPLDFAVR